MLTISLREFQLKPSKFIGDLPITLTIYNKPVAKVVSVNTSTQVLTEPLTDKKNVSTEVLTDKRSANTTSNRSVNKSIATKKGAFEALKEEVKGLEGSYNPVPKPHGKTKKKKWTPWEKSLGKCQIFECRRPAVEEVTVATIEGEDNTKKLCKVHAAGARKERGY